MHLAVSAMSTEFYHLSELINSVPIYYNVLHSLLNPNTMSF